MPRNINVNDNSGISGVGGIFPILDTIFGKNEIKGGPRYDSVTGKWVTQPYEGGKGFFNRHSRSQAEALNLAQQQDEYAKYQELQKLISLAQEQGNQSRLGDVNRTNTGQMSKWGLMDTTKNRNVMDNPTLREQILNKTINDATTERNVTDTQSKFSSDPIVIKAIQQQLLEKLNQQKHANDKLREIAVGSNQSVYSPGTGLSYHGNTPYRQQTGETYGLDGRKIPSTLFEGTNPGGVLGLPDPKIMDGIRAGGNADTSIAPPPAAQGETGISVDNIDPAMFGKWFGQTNSVPAPVVQPQATPVAIPELQSSLGGMASMAGLGGGGMFGSKPEKSPVLDPLGILNKQPVKQSSNWGGMTTSSGSEQQNKEAIVKLLNSYLAMQKKKAAENKSSGMDPLLSNIWGAVGLGK
jgi:hypothetical protein